MIFAEDRPGAAEGRVGHPARRPHPTWTIYQFDPTTSGLVPRPIMERLFPFGLTIEPPEGAAVDSWERAARVVHQRYLDSLGNQRDPTKPAQQPWADLSPFYRASNIRLVTATLAGAESVGRTWGPVPADQADTASTAVHRPAGADGRLEHESWHRFYLEQGWSYGATRDDARRVHNALRPWDQPPTTASGRSATYGTPWAPCTLWVTGPGRRRPVLGPCHPARRGARHGAGGRLAVADPCRRLAAGPGRRLPGPQR